MPVFRAYTKIIEKNIPLLIIYIVVFIGIAVSVMKTGAATQFVPGFEDARTRIAFVDEADSSILTGGLKDYLSRYAEIADLKHDTASLQDALFFDDIGYILWIPRGFTEDFMSGKPAVLEKASKPGSSASVYMDMHINKFLNTARFYMDNVPGISQKELVERVLEDLSNEVDVEVAGYETGPDNGEAICSFFNYMSYVLLNLLILGVSTFMIVFNQRDVYRRNLCSPISIRQQNVQILIGNLVYAVVCWGIMMALGFILYGKSMLAEKAWLMAINAFVFTMVALSIGFMVGTLLRSRNAQSAVTNVLSLGMCFTSGAFVPMYLLGDDVLNFARIFPTYWHIVFNNEMLKTGNITFETFRPFLGYIGMQLAIGIAVLAVSLVIIKQKRQTEEA